MNAPDDYWVLLRGYNDRVEPLYIGRFTSLETALSVRANTAFEDERERLEHEIVISTRQLEYLLADMKHYLI